MPHLSPIFKKTVIVHFWSINHLPMVKDVGRYSLRITRQSFTKAHGIEVVDELAKIIVQCPYCISKYLAKLTNG